MLKGSPLQAATAVPIVMIEASNLRNMKRNVLATVSRRYLRRGQYRGFHSKQFLSPTPSCSPTKALFSFTLSFRILSFLPLWAILEA